MLDAFEAEGLPSPEELDAAVVRDIERLARLQNWDGGFPYLATRPGVDPLQHLSMSPMPCNGARMMGYEVPDQMMAQLTGLPAQYRELLPLLVQRKIKHALSAYASVMRRWQIDDRPGQGQRNCWTSAGWKTILEGLAWIWQVLSRDAGYDSPA